MAWSGDAGTWVSHNSDQAIYQTWQNWLGLAWNRMILATKADLVLVTPINVNHINSWSHAFCSCAQVVGGQWSLAMDLILSTEWEHSLKVCKQQQDAYKTSAGYVLQSSCFISTLGMGVRLEYISMAILVCATILTNCESSELMAESIFCALREDTDYIKNLKSIFRYKILLTTTMLPHGLLRVMILYHP